MPSSNTQTRSLLLAFLALLMCELLLYLFVVKGITTPFIEAGDTTCYEYASQFVGDNFRWWPVPHLQMFSDQAVYPYGINQCMQNMVLEREYFVSIMRLCFGRFGWLQIDFLLTMFGGAVAVLMILRKEFGIPKALAVAILSIFCNFYALNKYPGHHCYCLAHWITINLTMDFLLLHLAWKRKPISLQLILARAMVFVLMLGQDPAYFTTMTLTAITVNQCVLWPILLRQLWQQSTPTKKQNRRAAIFQCIGKLLAKWRSEFSAHRAACLIMLLITLAAAWVYVPVLGQIALTSKALMREAAQQPMASYNDNLVMFSNTPLRLLVPYFPGFNPTQTLGFVTDPVESFGAGSVGWTFLLLAVMGCFMARKNWPLWLPTVIVLFLLVTYSDHFRTLKIFPWATFTRIASRGTILYAPLLALLSLLIDWSKFSRNIAMLLIGIFVLMGLVEVHTAWATNHRNRPYVVFTSDMASYMQRIKDEPGQAVLDWPFAIAGGNGTGNGQLSPYFQNNAQLFSFRALHGKKVMGCYFGRLYPQMILPPILAGWENMFMPHGNTIETAIRQTRSFDEAQWKFFTNFFELGDFAGINLCLDLISEGDEQNFYQRFGQPVATTTMPGVGRLAFIPKPKALRGHVDEAAAKNLKLDYARIMQLNGIYRFDQGLLTQAIPFLVRSVELEPNNAEMHNVLAIAFAKTDQLQQAQEHFQKAVQIQPNNPQYRNNLLRTEAALKRPAQPLVPQ